jgi:DNA-binding SARP family transcriptional activator
VLEISLLGEQRVAVDGSVVMALRSPRAMALLGFVLVHSGAPQRRDYIAAQFWPDCRPAQARANLRRGLHALRAGLPDNRSPTRRSARHWALTCSVNGRA